MGHAGEAGASSFSVSIFIYRRDYELYCMTRKEVFYEEAG